MRKLSIPFTFLLLTACSEMDGDVGPGLLGGMASGGTWTGGVGMGGTLPTGGMGVGTGGFQTGGMWSGGYGPTGGTLTGGGPTGGTGGGGVTTGGTGGLPPTGGLGTGGTGGSGAMVTGGTGGIGGIPTGGFSTGGTTGGFGPAGGHSTGGMPTGGFGPTGGLAGTGGGEPTGGTTGGGGSNTGGAGAGVVYECDLPAAGDGGKPRPSGSAANLKVLDWAGFSSAVSYSFDDSNSSQISHYDQMNALGGRYTFYLQTGKQESTNAVWAKALEDGHELGNHTQNHTCGTSDVDSAQSFIQEHFGVQAYTMAAPNGDSACQSSASKFLMIRSVSGGDISPKDNTNPSWIPSYIPGSLGTTPGKWKVYCIHGFTGGSDGAYQPIGFESFTSAVQQALSGGSWVDSVVNVGAYWIAQKAFSESGSNTWTWDLPNNFPPNKCLRVTVDGGTLSQEDGPIAWDGHGYYEISLDAGNLTWAP
ncbi:MAG: polysaccharide deacetylase [Polyangiaceae bacterium]|nr:polysaccharide deacetylase [Polyangiaceae bacterium]